MNNFRIRCILTSSEESITEQFDDIVAASWDDDEYAALVVLSVKAAEHSL